MTEVYLGSCRPGDKIFYEKTGQELISIAIDYGTKVICIPADLCTLIDVNEKVKKVGNDI